MADAATAPPKNAKKGGAKKPVSHLKYSVMISTAITALKERCGSSRQAIRKYISTNKVDENAAATELKRGVAAGTLKAACVSCSFRISKPAKPKTVAKKSGHKPAAKKPAAKKASVKKLATKKPAAKKEQ